MSALHAASRDEALAASPDSPATLEFRDIALNVGSKIYRSGEGLLLMHARERLAAAIGPVVASDVDSMLATVSGACELLADRAAYKKLHSSHEFERAIIQTLAGPWRCLQRRIDTLVIRSLAPTDSLDHLPSELRDEIEHQRPVGAVIAGFVDDVAASFAYVGSRSETYADISIDTLEEHRNRGVGAAVVSALIDGIVAEGRVPVWGAVEDNHASLRLAEKLGFTRPAGELFVHDP